MIDRYTYPQMAALWSGQSKIDYWLKVEIAVCEAWAERGTIPPAAMAAIRQATVDRARMEEIERETDHDVIAFLRAAGETVGQASRYIHLGLTSSDVVDTALSLQTVAAADLLLIDIEGLAAVLARRAVEFKDTIMIGRTHGVHAEPTTFGLKLALWLAEVRRSRERLLLARAEMAVGKLSGAVGTHANIPPQVEERACQMLGLAPAAIATQVLQRDRHATFLNTLAVIGGGIEQFATEIRHLQRTEVREVEEPFGKGQQGSSAMPHKRNPHKSERLAGLARLLRGYAVAGMEDIALWHERDISHSSVERVVFPDACLLLDYMVRQFTAIMEGLQVYAGRMRRNLEASGGLTFSQQVLLALVEQGQDRQAAYKLVQRNAMRVIEAEDAGAPLPGGFLAALQADEEITAHLSQETLARIVSDYDYHLKYVDVAFQRLGLL